MPRSEEKMELIYSLVCLIFLLCSPVEAVGLPTYRSTSKSQSSVSVTVYNNNMANIKDTREITLKAGEGELRFEGIASGIIPVTVRAVSLNYPDEFTVLEQNYEYDLMNAARLFEKYVGKKVKIVEVNKFLGKKEVFDAVLLSNNGGLIYKINGEVHLGHDGYVVLPKVSENLVAKPTLMWLYKNDSANTHKLEVSYLTRNITWKSDYVAVLNKDDTKLDISSWVTVDNNSGVTYKNASLKLVAGDIHEVRGKRRRDTYENAGMIESSHFQEKSFFEYHLYTMQRKTTIKDKQTKQIALIKAAGVGVKKELILTGHQNYLRQQRNVKKEPLKVYITFDNSKSNNLGIPLPGGIVRLYKRDVDDSLEFIGEDEIKHTPAGEEVKLEVGKAFDVIAERKQTDYREIARGVYESEWEIKLRNHKKQDVKVSLIESLRGSWRVISSSHLYKKIDAFRIRFDVNAPEGKEVILKYRVQVVL